MAFQQFANSLNPATTLSGNGGSISSGALTLVVASVANLPSNPNFTIGIVTSGVVEWMLVTGISGTTLTVTRHQEGSSAAGHNDGDNVYLALTAGVLTQLLQDTSNYGVDASAPSSATGARQGMRYKSSDAPYEHIFDGSNWKKLPYGALVLLEQHTASNSASLDFTSCLTSDFDEYEIHFVQILPATNAAGLRMRCSTDGGSTYDSGSNYSWAAFGHTNAGSATQGSQSDTSIGLLYQSLYNVHSSSGKYTFVNPAGASEWKQIYGNHQMMVSVDQTGSPAEGGINSGLYRSTTAVNAIRFLMTSGNITSGTIRVYGIAKGYTL